MPKSILDSDDVIALYRLDPSEFTKARNALAKALKEAGDKEAAAVVASLRRPSKVAAAINAVSSEKNKEVRAFLASTNELAEAQTKTIASGDATVLRSAAEKRRSAIKVLLDAVSERIGDSYRDEVVNTLEAASTDESDARLLLLGALTSQLHSDNAFSFAGAALPAEDHRGDEVAKQREVRQLQDAFEKAHESALRAAEDHEAAENELSRVEEWMRRSKAALETAKEAERAAAERLAAAKS